MSVRAAEFHVSAECAAEWTDEEEGIAKITLTQCDEPYTEMMNARTNYIFMVDGSRTTTLNDKYLRQSGKRDSEPVQSHCPCMADGHYYMIDGKKVLPVIHTLGYEYGTDTLRTWSAERKIWTDSAGAHFDGSGRRIAVRYQNGCLDIFTIFKNTAIDAIRRIAARADGSKVAFLSFSGAGGELYGVTDYTDDYNMAIRKIKDAGFLPGSLICPGLDRARKLYDTGGNSGATKVFIMGDGRNHDLANGIQKAKAFREQQGVMIYSACMGVEACTKGSGYDAMYELNGKNPQRFYRIRTSPTKDMAAAFAEVVGEKIPVKVTIDEKRYEGTIGGAWKYYENRQEGRTAQCSHGIFSHSGQQILWQIPQGERQNGSCSFYVQLSGEARRVAENTKYEVLEEAVLSGVIRGGTKDGETVAVSPDRPSLVWKISAPEVTKAELYSGNCSLKEKNVWYVKGGEENLIKFTAYVSYACDRWKPEENILYERTGANNYASLAEKKAVRSSDLSKLRSSYTSILYLDGESREYYPRTYAGRGANAVYTKQFDESKKLTLICDAIPPQLTGTIPERIREDTLLYFTAADRGSGVANNSFVLELTNKKTGEKKIFTASGTELSWQIRIDDPFYGGNISWTLRAGDRVGNETQTEGIANIRPPKSEETIANEIRTRIL